MTKSRRSDTPMHENSLANLRAPWKPGETPNPGGKPINARNRLNAAFLNALAKEFEKTGIRAVKKVATEQPDVFVKVLASILPKEMEVTRPLEEITDEQLNAAAIAIRAILAAQSDRSDARAKSKPESAEKLPAVPETG